MKNFMVVKGVTSPKKKSLLWHFCDDGVAQFRQSLCKGDNSFEITTRIESSDTVALRKGFRNTRFLGNTLRTIRDNCGI